MKPHKSDRTYLNRTKKWHKHNTQYYRELIRQGKGTYYTEHVEEPGCRGWGDFHFIQNNKVYSVAIQSLAYAIKDQHHHQAYLEREREYHKYFGEKEPTSFDDDAIRTPYRSKNGHYTGTKLTPRDARH